MTAANERIATVRAEVHSVISVPKGSDSWKAYLYDHTKDTGTQWDNGALSHHVVVTTATLWVNISECRSATTELGDVVFEAQRLAQYQCDRLQSGSYGAVVAGDHDQAQELTASFINA